MSIENTEELAQVIERTLEKALSKHREAVPLEHALWSTKEIGEYLQRPAQVVRERVVTVPGFPEAIRLPNFGGGKSRSRDGRQSTTTSTAMVKCRTRLRVMHCVHPGGEHGPENFGRLHGPVNGSNRQYRVAISSKLAR